MKYVRFLNLELQSSVVVDTQRYFDILLIDFGNIYVIKTANNCFFFQMFVKRTYIIVLKLNVLTRLIYIPGTYLLFHIQIHPMGMDLVYVCTLDSILLSKWGCNVGVTCILSKIFCIKYRNDEEMGQVKQSLLNGQSNISIIF